MGLVAEEEDTNVIFWTDDMALAAYLQMHGHEVVSMSHRRRRGTTGSTSRDISWGFDRGDALDKCVLELIGGNLVRLNLYKFMESLKDVRELMFEYKDNPELFKSGDSR